MFKGSVWQMNNEIPQRVSLSRSIVTEVAVIGAGLAGILIADRLQQEGKKVIILEADSIASGQTGKTTAKITAQHGCIYADIAENYGEESARLYAEANMKAVNWYRKTVEERKIDCAFEDTCAYLFTDTQPQRLEREEKTCRKIGLPIEIADCSELPFSAKMALKMNGQAQFDPLKFIKAVSKPLQIYEKTMVNKVSQNKIYCDNFTVLAEKIVFACHYPFPLLSGLYSAKMYQQRSYVIALGNTPNISGMYLGIDEKGLSLRSAGDFLLLGGAGHRTGENKGDSYKKLSNAAKRLFPESKQVAAWSAQDCITADRIPYIGRFSPLQGDWYIATGFGKWGMTSSAVAADIIADLICGRKNSAERLYSPSRFSLAAAHGIASEIAHSAKGLIKGNLQIPPAKLSSVRVGEGGIVNIGGKRIGVYRESEEKYYSVIPRCTHLGCGLEWNQDEKSWDCLCHGSRFDYMGNVMDNPAKKPLKHPPEL